MTVALWEANDITGESEWTITAVVELVDRQPQTTDIRIQAADGIQVERLQRDFRWATPSDIVRTWVPDVLAAGANPFDLEPPSDWWAIEGRRELTDEFLVDIVEEYLRQGRGYARTMAIKHHTTERTIRSWIDKARERGILTQAPGRGRFGGSITQTPRQDSEGHL